MGTKAEEKKIINLGRMTADIDDFRKFAEMAARLKPYADVCVSVSGVAEKGESFADSPWYEYAAYRRPLYRFFPHPMIEPHVPSDLVKKNRDLLIARSEILQKLGLGASYSGCEPFYMPGSFFDEYPHLRGPRVDHPARSQRPAFSCCTDQPETLEMYEWMIGELKKNVPGLMIYNFLANDSGSGFCWSDYLYNGKNGPMECQLRPINERMAGFIQALHNGAINNGGDIHVILHGHMNYTEHDMLKALAPPNTHLGAKFRSDPDCASVGTFNGQPSRGLLNPFPIISGMERFHKPEVKICSVDLGVSHYNRSVEPLWVCGPTLDLVEECITSPTNSLFSRVSALRKLAGKWGSEETADTITDAFDTIHQALKTTTKHPTVHEAVNTRYFNRPLVVRPELLTPEEEDYFLPHIFNTSPENARMDYVNIHGGRRNIAAAGGWLWDIKLRAALSSLIRGAKTLENLENVANPDFFKKVSIGFRIYASAVRSCSNFYYAQVFRDRNIKALSSDPDSPPAKQKISTGSLAQWYEIARDELDNVEELIGLVENGGREILITTLTPEEEGTFTLGPDILDQLKKKRETMIRRWGDIQK